MEWLNTQSLRWKKLITILSKIIYLIIRINAHNIAISIVGKDLDAQILSSDDLGRYFEADNKMEVA